MLAPAKLLGSRRFDCTQSMRFDQPLGVGCARPARLSEVAADRCRALERAGFTYWGAESDEKHAVSLVSYQRDGMLAQIADGPDVSPIVALFSFTSPLLTITADGETGVRGGPCANKAIIRGASIEGLLDKHRRRSTGYSRAQLSEDFVVMQFASAARAAFAYNLARGVYETTQNG